MSFFNVLPVSSWIHIRFQTRIRIRINLKSLIRIRIKSILVRIRNTGANYQLYKSIIYVEHHGWGRSRYRYRIQDRYLKSTDTGNYWRAINAVGSSIDGTKKLKPV
jgi:hypothetical protein